MTSTRPTTVAVLGAGFQGVCVAIELARRGLDVDLYDRGDRPITRAGLHNEGKIHLGFVYANEPGLATTRLLARGALAFEGLLRRWTGLDSPLALSSSHEYAVPRESLLPAAAIAAHFERVRAIVRETAAAHGGSYLGQDAATLDVSPAPVDECYDPRHVVARFRTDERAVDARALAEILRRRVADEPRIRFVGGTTITGVVRASDRYGISAVDEEGSPADLPSYRHVVNCLWESRLVVDRTVGRDPTHPPLHRLKHGVFLRLDQPRDDLPSTTFVLGQFGDIVNFGAGRLYLSWYPVARTALSRELAPPGWPGTVDEATATAMVERTLTAFGRLVPAVDGLAESVVAREVPGAVIVAAGRTDIDDPRSQLHERSAIGVWSERGYHSVDPGKYTMAPLFATEVADRIGEGLGR